MSVPRRMAQAFSLHDEDGMTTVGMVVSLLLALSMIFRCACGGQCGGGVHGGGARVRFRGAVFVVDQLDIHGFGGRRMLRSRRAGRGRQAA